MMDIDNIITIAGLILGGGGIGGVLTWGIARRKEKAEAASAEASATKEVQDVYQQLIVDVKTDREEQKAYIAELKEDRAHLRQDRDELRRRQDELEGAVLDLKREVARNGRQVEAMRPFLCGKLMCKDRQPVTISADGTVKKKRSNEEKDDV